MIIFNTKYIKRLLNTTKNCVTLSSYTVWTNNEKQKNMNVLMMMMSFNCSFRNKNEHKCIVQKINTLHEDQKAKKASARNKPKEHKVVALKKPHESNGMHRSCANCHCASKGFAFLGPSFICFITLILSLLPKTVVARSALASLKYVPEGHGVQMPTVSKSVNV